MSPARGQGPVVDEQTVLPLAFFALVTGPIFAFVVAAYVRAGRAFDRTVAALERWGFEPEEKPRRGGRHDMGASRVVRGRWKGRPVALAIHTRGRRLFSLHATTVEADGRTLLGATRVIHPASLEKGEDRGLGPELREAFLRDGATSLGVGPRGVRLQRDGALVDEAVAARDLDFAVAVLARFGG